MSGTTNGKKLEKVSWLAQRLDVTEWRAYELLRQHPEAGLVKIGGSVRVDPVRVEAWIARGGTAAEKQPARPGR